MKRDDWPFGKARPGGPWPPLGDEVYVLDNYHDKWRVATSSGGGYVFYDAYCPERCKILEWKQMEVVDDRR